MTRFKRCGQLAFVLAVSVCMFGGCSREESAIAVLRRELLLEREPSDMTSIAIAKEMVAENPDVSIIAQVSADEHNAFVRGKAVFSVIEILTGHAGQLDQNHVDNCPFCKRRVEEAPRAAVQFVGEMGDLLDVSASELVGIRPGDIVVVQGKGEIMNGIDMLKVTAKSIFVRTRADTSN